MVDKDERRTVLVQLLGTVRADVLQALDEPRTMGELAALVGSSASGLTYHVAALERAQLVRRRRTGSVVTVTRSDRGAELVLLLDTDPNAPVEWGHDDSPDAGTRAP